VSRAQPPPGVLGTLTLFFLKAGAFVFGSGLAIVPFLYGGVVREHHWLTERQFLDAIAVAMITRVRWSLLLLSSVTWLRDWRGHVAAAAVFTPPFLIVIIARHITAVRRQSLRESFRSRRSAAAVGAITGAVVIPGVAP